jgi:hypothetical protein
MTNEFEKLDQFVLKNIPLIKEGKELKRKKPIAKKSFVFAMMLLLMISFFVFSPTSSYQDAYAMEEVLMWDLTDEIDLEIELSRFD